MNPASYVKAPKPTLVKLEDSHLWLEACSIAEIIYAVLDELPEDEKWATASKLRNTANDLMYYISQAVSATSPASNEYEWSHVRKSIGALKTMYRFAGRQKFFELQPEVMVRFDKLIALVDIEVMKAYEQNEADKARDLETWHQKYKIWKATEL
jgi:hypothetical protein